jgi:hypothetical protein
MLWILCRVGELLDHIRAGAAIFKQQKRACRMLHGRQLRWQQLILENLQGWCMCSNSRLGGIRLGGCLAREFHWPLAHLLLFGVGTWAWL